MGAGFGITFKDGTRDPGNSHRKALRSGISDGKKKFETNSTLAVGMTENTGNLKLSIFHHADRQRQSVSALSDKKLRWQ